MAEAVRPRKKHRKKKEGRSSKHQSDDRTSQLLQDDEDTEETKEESHGDQGCAKPNAEETLEPPPSEDVCGKDQTEDSFLDRPETKQEKELSRVRKFDEDTTESGGASPTNIAEVEAADEQCPEGADLKEAEIKEEENVGDVNEEKGCSSGTSVERELDERPNESSEQNPNSCLVPEEDGQGEIKEERNVIEGSEMDDNAEGETDTSKEAKDLRTDTSPDSNILAVSDTIRDEDFEILEEDENPIASAPPDLETSGETTELPIKITAEPYSENTRNNDKIVDGEGVTDESQEQLPQATAPPVQNEGATGQDLVSEATLAKDLTQCQLGEATGQDLVSEATLAKDLTQSQLGEATGQDLVSEATLAKDLTQSQLGEATEQDLVSEAILAKDLMQCQLGEATGQDLVSEATLAKDLTQSQLGEATAVPVYAEHYGQIANLSEELVITESSSQILSQQALSTQSEHLNPGTETKSNEDVLRTETSGGSLVSQQEGVTRATVQPMTVDELEIFYHNPKLKQQEQFVERFAKLCNIERHEFYELVINYFKARNNMLAIRADIDSLHHEYTSLKERLWTIKDTHVLAKGMCADNVVVKENFVYQTVHFNQDVHRDLERHMKYTRSNYHDTFALCSYTAQLSKLQIESYIHQLYLRNPLLMDVAQDGPVTAHLSPLSSERESQMAKLRDCISVLFCFQRRPVNDVEFLKTSRSWLGRMVATFLRLATLEDHLFLLNHILRSPAGIDGWAASYLQIACPSHPSQRGESSERWPYSLGSPVLDHFVNMLAFFMRPIKYRSEFLAKIKKSVTPNPSEKPGPFNWTLLDEDGEEDEDTDNTLLNENDLVAILAQYPFDKMFKYVLQMTDSDGESSYSVERVGSHHIMQLIAFASSLIQVLHQGVQTFNRSRYRQFVKRIGRLIRHTVQQVSDHWLNYHSWRRDVCHDADNVKPSIEPLELQHSLHDLQVEFDHFFFRATRCIMSAPRLGTWQFMTNMPYTSLSSIMMWNLLWFLHQNEHSRGEPTPGSNSREDGYTWSLSDPANKDEFEVKLMDMPMSEVIYLLTTFANMCSARSAKEKNFIDFVVEEIYELAYLRTHTREFCSKIGRELLSAIATTHPFIISTLLHQVQKSSQNVGAVSLYLFRGLPLHLWQPLERDIIMVKEWLLEYDLAKPENQLARLVLSKMNWGYNEQGDALFLDLRLHRNSAIFIIEAYMKILAAKSSQASRLGTGPFSSQEHMFDLWAWELVAKLRLHRSDQPSQPLLASSEGAIDSTFGALPDPDTDTTLYPLQKALQMNVAIGCYVSTAMTKTGHSIDSFITKGIPNLITLIQAGCQRFCLPLLAMVVPIFLDEDHPDYLLTNEKFLAIVYRILQADHQSNRSSSTGSNIFPGNTTSLFAGMVMTQLQRSLAPGTGALQAESVLEFWYRLLTARSGWHFDQDVCYILDVVLSAIFCNKGGCAVAEKVLLESYKDIKVEPKPQGFLSSVLSFVSSGSPLPSLLEKQSMERPWLAYCILSAETKYLESINILKEVSMELCSDTSMTPDAGLKRACQKLRFDYALTVGRLPIYRWAQLALETDIDHPLLPVIWQRFFTIYLQRATADTGVSQRGSVGQRYFQSIANLTYLKRLKKRLRQTADFHHEASRKKPPPKISPSSSSLGSDDKTESTEEEVKWEGLEEGLYEMEAEQSQSLVQLYQMYLLWLEEPLLHDPSLYLPSLPLQYEAEKLSRIFNGDQDLWMEYVNVSKTNHHTVLLVKSWMGMSQPELSTSGSTSGIISEEDQINSATSRILSRLTNYNKRLDPPSLVPVVPPVPDVPKELLVNNHAMLVFLQDDIKQLLFYADTFSDRENHNVVMDCEYLEMVPDLYANKKTETHVQIACKSSYNPMYQCKGKAVVTVKHKEKQRNDTVFRKLEENRVEFKQLSIESLSPPPPTVVVSAVHIENAITDLIHFTRALSDNTAEFEAAKQTGISLLYHLGQQMKESARHYPPTRQFFSSCIEILGQEFIRPYPDQAQPLLQAVLSNCNLAGLLAPNLAPNHCGDSFVQMYCDVVRVGMSDVQDTAFMLLTKFDPAQWLSNCEPALAVRSQFIEVLGEALVSCGLEMDNRCMMMFGIYRTHLQVMLKHHFPEHYGDVLRLILKGSEERFLHKDIWKDTLATLGCPYLSISTDAISSEQVQELIKMLPILSLQQLFETIDWLTAYFSRQRSSNPQSGQFGLHSNWKLYHEPLISFIGYIGLNVVILEAHRVIEANLNVEQAVRHLWSVVTGLFSPWIVALEVPSPTNPNTNQLLPPWIDGDEVPAGCLVSMFSHAVGCIQAQFQGYLAPPQANPMTSLWPFYYNTLARKGLRVDILLMYHQHLAKLPWNQFNPDLTAMELMIQIFEDGSQSCLEFLGSIFPQIPWGQVCDGYCQGSDTSMSNSFLSYLLSLLVIFLNEDNIMKTQGVAMQHLLAQAKDFPWQLLDVSSYNCAATWQTDRCNPKCVLGLPEQSDHNSTRCGSSVAAANYSPVSSMSLMHEVARFGNPSSSDSADDSSKRAAYVKLVVRLLSKCSLLNDARSDWFPPAVHQLLNDIELLSTAGGPTSVRHQELASLLSTLLTLLNNCSPIHDAPNAILGAIVSWFEASTSSALCLPCITAACRTLASIKHLAVVVEACIEANFNSNMDLSPDPSRGWTNVLHALHVPELTHQEFLGECSKQGSILTLYAYLGQRSPLCQSLEEEYTLYTELVDWCVKNKLRPANEAKVFLWWHKALQMTLHQVEFGAPHWTLSRSLNNLIPSMVTQGEDRSSSGILGAIGFGRQSDLSYRFRVIARSMASFISAQVLRNGTIRMEPNDPGAITLHRETYPQSPTTPDVPKPSSLAYQALKQLDAAIDNKNYVGLTEHARYSRTLVLDGSKTLKDAMHLLGHLVALMFPEKHYLSVIRVL
ncbi:ectopic P granules protein 5 homolog isoform X2 [Asterias amurensis]|uniref:ectopic P granules protein 5 homolog isoform X2 n=1 Tax=Asterias amurensis TaxID=7602 RepID=UPI003AB63314